MGKPNYKKGMDINDYNPYPLCHNVLFQISDENWEIIEKEFNVFKNDPANYKFPRKPFGGSIISEEHKKAIHSMFKDVLARK